MQGWLSEVMKSPRQTGVGRYRKSLVLLSLLIISSCSNELVPPDATLTITPEKHTTRIIEQQNAEGLCLFDERHYQDIPILLQLNTADGSPIGDSELTVYVDFAENTYSGLTTLELYNDLNSNGVVDAQTEYISGSNDDIARVKTDKWSGTRMLLLRINLSCAFQGEIFAYTSGVSGRAEIEVVADDIVQPDVTTDTGETG